MRAAGAAAQAAVLAVAWLASNNGCGLRSVEVEWGAAAAKRNVKHGVRRCVPSHDNTRGALRGLWSGVWFQSGG